jgi:Fe2+ or Zn2+ uptake regulation protein
LEVWPCGHASAQNIYEAIVASPGHYSPEQTYANVQRRIPSISLATVYNNLRLFVEHGCTRCKVARDIEGDFINLKTFG